MLVDREVERDGEEFLQCRSRGRMSQGDLVGYGR